MVQYSSNKINCIFCQKTLQKCFAIWWLLHDLAVNLFCSGRCVKRSRQNLPKAVQNTSLPLPPTAKSAVCFSLGCPLSVTLVKSLATTTKRQTPSFFVWQFSHAVIYSYCEIICGTRVNLAITNNPKGGLFRPFRRAFTWCTSSTPALNLVKNYRKILAFRARSVFEVKMAR